MTTDVRRYLTARSTRGATVAPDGRLALLADLTGTMQVWTLDEPAGWPRQRTFYDERISFVSWSPDGTSLVFGKDEGADEHDQLFRLDPDSGEIARLTDRDDAIHQWGCWGPDGDRIAFAANRRDPGAFDVCTMAIDGGDPTLVRKGEGLQTVHDWSPDGSHLLVGNAHSSSDQDLYHIDVDSGDRRHLTPHDGDARYLHPSFGPNGGVYCTSDANADTKELVWIDPASLDVETVVDGGDWSVDGLTLDAGTGRVAYTRNVDGYAETYVGHLAAPTDLDATAIDHPKGVVEELTFGPRGERAAMTVSSTNLNYSIYVVDLGDIEDEATPRTTRWTTPSPGGVPLDRYHEPELIRYETFDGREIPAFVTLPTGASDDPDGSSIPAIVDIHGGPHHQRRPSWRDRPVRQYFLDRGYAIVEPNVRGSSGYGREYAALDDVEKRMDSVRDVRAGVEWLHDHPAIDDDRIVCYGRSYGGFMVLACITEYPDLWAAAVDFVGIANWITFLENTGDWRRSHREAEYGSLEEDREFLESISPIHSVDRIECPLFVQHGVNDPRVPVEEARAIAERVEDRGVPVETCIFEDEGHHTTKLENRIELFGRIAAFLDEYV